MKKIEYAVGILPADRAGQYYVYDGSNHRVPEGVPLHKANPFWMARILVEVTPQAAKALSIEGQEKPSELRARLGQPGEVLPDKYNIPITERICLELAKMK